MPRWTRIADVTNEYFDIDYMDIKDKDNMSVFKYSNIPCNAYITSSDTPDGLGDLILETVVEIHMKLGTDIVAGNYVVIKKMSEDGKLLKVYGGTVAQAVVDSSRMKATMRTSAFSDIEPEFVPPPTVVTPPPPPNKTSSVTVHYEDINSVTLLSMDILTLEINRIYDLSKDIDGYKPISALIDGVVVDTVDAFTPTKPTHEITYTYEEIPVEPPAEPYTFYRLLCNGTYTKDDGQLANGYHLYKKIPIISYTEQGDFLTIVIPSKTVQHDELGTINLSYTKKILVYGLSELAQLLATPTAFEGNFKVTIDKKATTTQAERDAYVTHYYDDF